MQARSAMNVFMALALLLGAPGSVACDDDGASDPAGPDADHGDADAGREGDADVATGPGPLAFPDDFLFGVATAGFQVDMGCPTLPAEQCRDQASDWYAYVTSEAMQQESVTHLAGDLVSKGPGHWEMYEVDPDHPDKTRVPRGHVETYRGIAGSRAISLELQERYPAPEEEQ
ncbi:MAG: hypothetical protein ACQEXJ_20455 [Myxococcota bacterium]